MVKALEFLGSTLVVKIPPSNAGGVDSIPGPEITVPYAVECSQNFFLNSATSEQRLKN